ncbi:MAG: hypothetical protein OEV42_07410 [Deltaproteobacteria bacterium]|nr:hypothetical protein [Deltaproteobacteria bacterium]
MRGFFLLANLRFRMFVNTVRTLDRAGFYKFLFFFVLAFFFVLGDYSFFYRIIDYLNRQEMIGSILITQLLEMMTLTFFFMLFFSTVVAAISTMYLSSELDLLLSSPLGTTSIFVIKFFQTVINSSWMVLLFGLPMLVALGSVFDKGINYYIGMVLLFVPFIFVAAGLGILFTVTLIRYFPAKGLQQVMTFMLLLFLSGLVIFFRFMRPEALYREIEMADNMVMAFFEGLSVPKSPYFPSAWFTRGLINMVEGHHDDMWMPFLYLLLLSLFLFGLVIIVARYVYFSGLSEAGTTSIRGNVSRRDVIERVVDMLPVSIQQRALLSKDAKVFFRDAGQWSQLFILGALVVVYIFNIKNLPLNNYYLKNLIAFLNLGLAGFVLASVAIRFVFPSVSLEGGSMWIIKRSPMKMSSFLWEKYFAFLLPLLILGEILMIGSNLLLQVDNFMMTLSIITIFLITLAVTGLGVGMGALYPRFRYENIAQVAAGAGGIIYMVISLAYIGIVIILEARPVYTHFKRQIFIGDYSMASLYVSLAAIVVLTVLAVFIPMKKGIEALENLDL